MHIKKPADQRSLISLTIWKKSALLDCVIVRQCVFSETLAKQGNASLAGQGFQRRHQPPSGGCELKLKSCCLSGAVLSQPPSGGCELKRCVPQALFGLQVQPPSGGCELKPSFAKVGAPVSAQPPSGGCELKRVGFQRFDSGACQPPSGGCELKRGLMKK